MLGLLEKQQGCRGWSRENEDEGKRPQKVWAGATSGSVLKALVRTSTFTLVPRRGCGKATLDSLSVKGKMLDLSLTPASKSLGWDQGTIVCLTNSYGDFDVQLGSGPLFQFKNSTLLN